MNAPSLTLRDFGIAFGDRVILADVSLELSATGMTVLVGPAGSGKSTLLRTLAGLNDPHPSLATWGDIWLAGEAVPVRGGRHVTRPEQRPLLVVQHARFFLDSVRENLVSALSNRSELDRSAQTRSVAARLQDSGLGYLLDGLDRDVVTLPLREQRALAIARALVADPALLFTDEPTAGLDDRDALELVRLLRREAQARAVVYVTHHQKLARAAGGTTILLAGGRVQEVLSTEAFFSTPRTELGRRFVATGGCPTAAPHAAADSLEESSVAPRGFFWVEPGRLGGLPRPGILSSLEHDLRGLSALRVSKLVTLEERPTVDPIALARRGIESRHFPIADMGVPSAEATVALCRQVDAWKRAGEVIAYHCRAGLGRTGTMLASRAGHDRSRMTRSNDNP